MKEMASEIFMFAGNSGGYILCFLAGFDVLAAASGYTVGFRRRRAI
tara:strand:+ start:196319 stop:196456 length:138 start_codon:yes stop_codon:yes gene_type:complete